MPSPSSWPVLLYTTYSLLIPLPLYLQEACRSLKTAHLEMVGRHLLHLPRQRSAAPGAPARLKPTSSREPRPPKAPQGTAFQGSTISVIIQAYLIIALTARGPGCPVTSQKGPSFPSNLSVCRFLAQVHFTRVFPTSSPLRVQSAFRCLNS